MLMCLVHSVILNYNECAAMLLAAVLGKKKQFSENPGTASETATSTVRSGEVEQFEDIARNWRYRNDTTCF